MEQNKFKFCQPCDKYQVLHGLAPFLKLINNKADVTTTRKAGIFYEKKEKHTTLDTGMSLQSA